MGSDGMDMLVSVIVVTYNSEKTVIETLDSIYNQSYKNIELIISDDASKDNTVEVIYEWINKYKNRFARCVVLTSKKNRGVVGNCNRAASVAEGVYYEFVAGDDMITNNCVEEKIKFAEEKNSDIVFCKVKIIGSHFQKINELKRCCNYAYRIIEKGYQAQYKAILKNNYIVGPSGVFIKKTYFDKCNGYDKRFPMVEDYPFYYKYIVGGNTVELLNKELEIYRVTGKSISTQAVNVKFNKSLRDFFYRVRLKEILKNKEYNLAKELIVTNLGRLC